MEIKIDIDKNLTSVATYEIVKNCQKAIVKNLTEEIVQALLENSQFQDGNSFNAYDKILTITGSIYNNCSYDNSVTIFCNIVTKGYKRFTEFNVFFTIPSENVTNLKEICNYIEAKETNCNDYVIYLRKDSNS